MRSRGLLCVLIVSSSWIAACGELKSEEREDLLVGVWRTEPTLTDFGAAVITLALKEGGEYSMRFDPIESDMPAWNGRGLWRVEDRILHLEGPRIVSRRMTLRADVLDLEGDGNDPTWRMRRVP